MPTKDILASHKHFQDSLLVPILYICVHSFLGTYLVHRGGGGGEGGGEESKTHNARAPPRGQSSHLQLCKLTGETTGTFTNFLLLEFLN